jgi:hypothetical protein
MAVVYIHMKPNTRDIFYVGIGNDIKRAYRNEGRNDHWTKVYNKYGKVVDIVAQDISLDAAREMEKHLIASLKDSLCNKTLGGEGFFGGVHSEETKEKLRKANTGKKLSDETKRKISEKSKGHPNYFVGPLSQEARMKISATFKGKKRSEQFCQKVKESKQGYRPHPSAWENAAKLRKDKAVLIKELTTGFVGKIWEIQERFDIQKQAVYSNYKHDKPITKFKWEGLNFVKL